MGIVVNVDEFLARANYIHSGKYGYDLVKFVNLTTKVVITCPIHGEFRQNPYRHLSGQGCPKCRYVTNGNKRRKKLEEFIKKAIELHGNKYDYSKVVYVNNWTKVIIICPIHGEFEQVPSNHLKGHGCQLCANIAISEGRKLTLSEFILRSRVIHEDRYCYDEFILVTYVTKGKIKCNKCGSVFKQNPSDHLQGYGCPYCRSSKGELAIKAILDKQEIEYQQEYKIPNVKTRFEYDFYLPGYNLLVEFHGKQHYEPVEFFGGYDAFVTRLVMDDTKKELAKAWGYRYLCIKYTTFKKLSKEDFERRFLKLVRNLNIRR